MTSIIQTDKGRICAVSVPEGHIQKRSFFVNTVNVLRYTEFSAANGKYPVSKAIPLPEGSWLFIATTKTISEEQARELVDWGKEVKGTIYRSTAHLCLHSLLAQHNITDNRAILFEPKNEKV